MSTLVLSTVHHLPPLILSGTWLHQTPWPDDTVLTMLFMTTGWSHPKGCFPGLLTLDPESAHDRVGHTLLGKLCFSLGSRVHSLCSSISTGAPAGVSNVHP